MGAIAWALGDGIDEESQEHGVTGIDLAEDVLS
jgi:hypothetical protein